MSKTSVERRNHAWFALVDAEHCRLLCCSLTQQGTQHVDEYGTFDNTLPEQEHMRPMSQAGETHNVEENERHFAAEVAEWLQKQGEKHELDRLTILAPPRMLGVLRNTPFGSMRAGMKQVQGDLMRLNTGQLAEHQMVRNLVRTRQER
jgi:protein required for attachment to host cells